MVDRRKDKTRVGSGRREYPRTPGKFNQAVDAAYKVMRQYDLHTDMETVIARYQGDLYPLNLMNRLLYDGFKFGDEVRIRVDLVKRPEPEQVHDPAIPKRYTKKELDAVLTRLQRSGKTIEAIKLFREQKDVGLKEAVDYVRSL